MERMRTGASMSQVQAVQQRPAGPSLLTFEPLVCMREDGFWNDTVTHRRRMQMSRPSAAGNAPDYMDVVPRPGILLVTA